MSLVVDQVRYIDGHLDRLQLSGVQVSTDTLETRSISSEIDNDPLSSTRIRQLQTLIKALSTSFTSSSPLASSNRINTLLGEAKLSETCETCKRHFREDSFAQYNERDNTEYEHELEWLLISKAAMQTYGQILETILGQTIPLSDDLEYWEDILGSYRYAGLYSIQTSPLRLWSWTQEILKDVRARGGAVTDGWSQFYALVRQSARDRSIAHFQRRVVSPLALVRNEARKKQATLQRMRILNGNALGMLLSKAMTVEDGSHALSSDAYISDSDGEDISAAADRRQRWKYAVIKSLGMMESVLQTLSTQDLGVHEFEDSVFDKCESDQFYQIDEATQYVDGSHVTTAVKPAEMINRLQGILTKALPQYTSNYNALLNSNGKPSRIVRYWFPATVLLVSSGTVLRVLVNRQAEIMTWIQEFGVTVRDFWANWVIEPTKKIIGTIRHDEDSEVSIMSKRSLEGDRDSLERMVLDFAKDNPVTGSLTEAEIADLRVKIKEGDLTPVLRAYERDMARPFMGTIRGNLIRGLLIQVQKTKVDVEVAMSGIDQMLKSQELLFGFIGLTPGVLVLVGISRWVTGFFGNRRGLKLGRKQGTLLRILRNIDRILVSAAPDEEGRLQYKDHGLLLCEVHVLRQSAKDMLPRRAFQDLLHEFNDLVDIRSGRDRQMRVAERIRWAYPKWLR